MLQHQVMPGCWLLLSFPISIAMLDADKHLLLFYTKILAPALARCCKIISSVKIHQRKVTRKSDAVFTDNA